MGSEKKENAELQGIAISPLVSYIGGEAFVIAGAIGWNSQYGIPFLILGAIIFGLGSLLAYLPVRNEYARKKEFSKKVRRNRVEDIQLHLDTIRLSFDANKTKIEKTKSLENQYWTILSQIESRVGEIQAELDSEKEKKT